MIAVEATPTPAAAIRFCLRSLLTIPAVDLISSV
jgi:hypothetical protein